MLAIFFLTGCSLLGSGVRESQVKQFDLTTVSAAPVESSAKTAERTLTLETPVSIVVGVDWTPSPGEIVASDAGKNFDIRITSRISLILQEKEYPAANLELHCTPADSLGRISNVPAVPNGYYVFRYEGVQPGLCTVQNGQFEITIKVIN